MLIRVGTESWLNNKFVGRNSSRVLVQFLICWSSQVICMFFMLELGRSLKDEILFKNIKEKLNSEKIQEKIKIISDTISKEICADVPNAFWNRKKHQVSLPYTDEFSEDKIPTKARPIAMGPRLLNYCKEEIDSLLKK